MLDYGIYWDCNLHCSYCRKVPIRSANPSLARNSIDRYIRGLERTALHVDAVLFKTSGWGEVTLVHDYLELFRAARRLGYQENQLITNGTNVRKEQLVSLQNLGHFSLQVSLDGVGLAENVHRFPPLEAACLVRVWETVETALSMGIPVELNSVLTETSTSRIQSLLERLLALRERYLTQVVCLPRRVRVKSTLGNRLHLPSYRAAEEFEKVVCESYDKYEPVLPPLAYLEGVVSHLRDGYRSWTAYDTLTRVNIGAAGQVVLHTKDGNVDLGSVFDDDKGEAAFLRRENMHSALGDANYQDKLTQFDIHSLFIGGQITIEEIARLPSCSSQLAQARLQRLRRAVADARVCAS